MCKVVIAGAVGGTAVAAAIVCFVTNRILVFMANLNNVNVQTVKEKEDEDRIPLLPKV